MCRVRCSSASASSRSASPSRPSRRARPRAPSGSAEALAKLDQTPAPSAGPVVTGFSGGGFRVGTEVYAEGLILTPTEAIAWAAPAIEALVEADLAPLLALSPLPEFVLLGTGTRLARPDPRLTAALDARGIGIEAMDSRAAARAWGLLRGEGRHIAAALLPLG